MNKYQAVFILILSVAIPAKASFIRIDESNFLAGSGLITFSEFSIDTTNPFYTAASYGGSAGAPDVSFDGYFAGQSISSTPGVDCPGAAASACVIGSPTGPLQLDSASPDTRITSDSANPTSPVLSGSPRFSGPIAALFSVDVAGVGFDGGFFDAPNSTAITAFARDGSLLGSVSNVGTGIEFLGLATDDGSESIAGFFLDLVGAEPFGFAIDNIRFGSAVQIDIPGNPGNPDATVPAPATLALFGLGLAALGRKRRKA